MKLEKPTPRKLIIKSNLLFIWIISGFLILLPFFTVFFLWQDSDYLITQGLAVISILLIILFLFKPISLLRLPTHISTFDVNDSQFMIEKKWIWAQKNSQYLIENIKNVHVIQKGRTSKGKIYFKLEVELFSGETLPLSSTSYRPESSVRKVAEELRKFLSANSSFKPINDWDSKSGINK